MSDQAKGVPLLDLKRIDEALANQMREAFDRVLRSGMYVMGPEVDALEKELASHTGVKHAIGVSSGTDALLLALMALDIKAGDEVICPTYTFFATAGSIWRTGARPVLCDIDAATFNMDPKGFERLITPKTRAVMPVHLFGQCAEMDPILEICRARNIPIIEDAAQAIGSEYKGRRAGTMGSFGAFSFFPSKNLGALGDAGFISSNDDALAERARILRTHGSKPKYYHRFVGGNFRIDALQAALLRVKLPHLESWTAARQKHAALYRTLITQAGLLERGVQLPVEAPQRRHIYNQFNIRVTGAGRRDQLKTFFTERKIGCEIYYPLSMHQQDCFKALGHKPGDFPHAEAAALETLAVPIFPELKQSEIETVVAALSEFCKK